MGQTLELGPWIDGLSWLGQLGHELMSLGSFQRVLGFSQADQNSTPLLIWAYMTSYHHWAFLCEPAKLCVYSLPLWFLKNWLNTNLNLVF